MKKLFRRIIERVFLSIKTRSLSGKKIYRKKVKQLPGKAVNIFADYIREWEKGGPGRDKASKKLLDFIWHGKGNPKDAVKAFTEASMNNNESSTPKKAP